MEESMATIRLRQFRSAAELTTAVADLLQQQLSHEFGRPHAIMLSGGSTPFPAYQELVRRKCRCSDDSLVCFSDERYVPEDSLESNFGRTRRTLEALGLPEDRTLRVHIGGGLKPAAAQYDRDLKQFVKSGGRLTLGLLGLGSDGHTASLFGADDIARGQGAYAIAIPREEKPDRISVTPDLLKRFEALIFLVVGGGKQDIVNRLLKTPAKVTAGQAVCDAPSVQLWLA
jgi:6-phosphogluconolactonase/glucosamine-6-phosphate isomerase/deaminase